MDTLKSLERCRDEIADLFEEKYPGQIQNYTSFRGYNGGYHLGGFKIRDLIEIRMKIDANLDRNRRIYFSRKIPFNFQQRYFIERAIIEIEEDKSLNEKMNFLDRPREFMFDLSDIFKLNFHGIGLSTNYDSPIKTGKILIEVDNKVDNIIQKPCEDPIIIKMAEKIKIYRP
mgnify:CR=1 FL=1